MAVTDAFCVAVLAIGIAYDVYAGVRWGKDATISRRIRHWSHEYPALPFALGFLAGHWFW